MVSRIMTDSSCVAERKFSAVVVMATSWSIHHLSKKCCCVFFHSVTEHKWATFKVPDYASSEPFMQCVIWSCECKSFAKFQSAR